MIAVPKKWQDLFISGFDTLANFSFNLYRNKIARQVAKNLPSVTAPLLQNINCMRNSHSIYDSQLLFHPRRPRDGDFHGRKFTTRAGEPPGTYSYRSSCRSVWILSFWLPEKYFSGQSAKRNSQATLMSSYTRLFSSLIAVVAWPVQREHFWGQLQKEKINKY